MSHILISATRKSSGKTVFSVGLCRALQKRGVQVQPYKKGPDYIDPMWLTVAASRPCVNLDFNTMSHSELLNTFGARLVSSDIGIIEGNKGLFDGMDLHGSDCNAALAALLKSPVIIVVDGEGMTRGIAPLLNGYSAFEDTVKIAGVVLNNLGGSRHESKLRNIIEHYTDIELIGAIQRDEIMCIPERHLGLTTDKETESMEQKIDQIARAVENQVDVEEIKSIADASPVPLFSAVNRSYQPTSGIRIGIARDAAFCFYYPDDFAVMESHGAEIIFFDTLHDTGLPQVDALIFGGGFPETHCSVLADNVSMKAAISNFVKTGRPVYAECGGLMYLSREIKWRGQRSEMVGVIPADSEVHDRPIGRGCVELEYTSDHPWIGSSKPDTPQSQCRVKAHEFHYSSLSNLEDSVKFGYRVKRGHGIDGCYDGLVFGNIFASYAHMRHTESNPWITRFISFITAHKKEHNYEGEAVRYNELSVQR